MKRRLRILAVLLASGLAAGPARAEEAVVTVLPAGAEPPPASRGPPRASGRPDGAGRVVRDLPSGLALAARLRRARPDRAVTVRLGPGTHRVAAPVRIGPEAGGRPGAPLTIAGAPDGSTRLIGSVTLRPNPGPVPAALLARAPPAARPHLRAYRLPPETLAAPRFRHPRLLKGDPAPPALAIRDGSGPLRPAAWPNEGWAEAAGPAPENADPLLAPPAALRIERLRAEPDLWAEGFWRWGWLFETIPVSAVESGRLRLASMPYGGIAAGARFRLVHALSELDEPGEWVRDRASGLLLAWPRPGREELEVSVADTLLALDGASQVRMEHLRLENARGDLLSVRGGRDVVLADSVLRAAGGHAAVFEGSQDGGIERADIAETGLGAVRLGGGDRARLVPGGLFLRDSRITGYALSARTQNPAVALDGVGASVTGTLVHDSPEYALHLRGNDHRVEGNAFLRLLAGATDTGAIYAGRDWTARGSVIRHNLLQDIASGPGLEVKGVYLDDMASGFTVAENLFVRVQQPVFIGGGRDNRVVGNVFVASSPAIHVDGRGETWARREIEDPGSELRTAFAAVPVGSVPWRERYPGLAGILSDRPGAARGNAIARNLFVGSEPFRFVEPADRRGQRIMGNRGPDGIRLRSGSLPADPGRLGLADLPDLTGPDGAPVLPFDPGALAGPARLAAPPPPGP